MSKRMTDTGKWDKKWYREMPVAYKLFWQYILDRCDLAGFWDVDFEAAKFFIGSTITKDNALKYINDQIYRISDSQNNDKYWLILDFIRFQNGWPLNPSSPVHKKIIDLLNSKGIEIRDNTLYDTLSNRVCHTQQVIVGVIVEVEDIKEPENFKKFWEAYPRKVGIDKAKLAWKNKKSKPNIDVILAKLETQKKSEQWTKENGQFIPLPATYINQGRWHDEIEKPKILKPDFTF